MKCPNPECEANIPDHEDRCPGCGTPVEVPNVRAARKREEREALARRLDEEETAARQRGCEEIIERFRDAISRSQAVLSRPLGIVQVFLEDNRLLPTFYQEVKSGARLPEENKWDRARLPVDATLFPYYFECIHFALLSINGRGAMKYGGAAMVLRDAVIRSRTTVFEKNSIIFCREHGIIVGNPIPPGYRATWDDRGKLAIAKLSSKLNPDTQAEEFSNILLEQKDEEDSDEPDFIEVHIYGRLHHTVIERATLKIPKRRADRGLYYSVRRKLIEKLGRDNVGYYE
jgi:hypothetical protein